MKIILTQGIQGSGKSTWAKNWVNENPEGRVRWNNDDIRNMLGPYWIPIRENSIGIMKESFIKTMMKYGYDIVIDDMNLNPKTIDQITSLVDEQNKILNTDYKIELKQFFISVEECILRDSTRPNPIGEKVIRDTWKRYRNYIWNIKNREFYDSLTGQNENLKHCIIVDLDGTVALNLSGRPYYGEGCGEKIKDDIAITPIVDIISNYNGEVLFVTGRDESVRKETEEWIINNIPVSSYKLIMRKEGDYSDGVKYKENVYLNQIKDNYYVDYVLEDSNKIVKMYREHGLIVLQPNEG